MCGLSGFCGSKPVPLDKMKILGLYNLSRGKHSCGYYTDGVLRLGVDAKKEWDDFITDGLCINKDGSKGGKVFIGHTRSATKGSHTIGNAHPFQVENMILAHNGTLDNAFTLCNDNDIDHSAIFVDSLALALLIKKVGWSILDKYVGYAALLIAFEDEPDSLYVYHGASRNKHNDETSYEERPMFYMEGKSCVYFASLSESLMAIRDTTKQIPLMLPHNAVYKFTNGKLDEIVYRTDRKDINLDFCDPIKKAPVVPLTKYEYPERTKQTTLEFDIKAPVAFSVISRETEPKEANIANKIYFQKGRYWQKKVDNGNIQPLLLNGKYLIERGGSILDSSKKAQRHTEEYYFVDGIMMRGKKQYETVICLTGVKDSPYTMGERIKGNFAYHMSKFSKYPVTCMEFEGTSVLDDTRFRWWLGEKRFSGVMNLKFANRRYEIADGRLVRIHRQAGDLPLKQSVREEDKNSAQSNAERINQMCAMAANTNKKITVTGFCGNRAEQEEEQRIISFFHCNWLNLDEIKDMPPAVYGAIEVYIDTLLDKMDLGELGEIERNEYYQDFLKTCINNGVTFYENMEKDLQDELQYYVQVAMQEIKDAQEGNLPTKLKALPDVDTVPNLKAVKRELDRLMDAANEMDNDVAPVDDASSFTDFEIIDDFIESGEAKKQFDEVIAKLVELRAIGDKCQAMEKNDLAQSVAYTVYNTIDTFKSIASGQIADKELLRRMAWVDNPFM